MDFERISKVGAGNGTAQVESSSVPLHTESVQQNLSAGRKVMEKEPLEKDKQNQEHAPSEATISDSVSRANRHMEKTRCEYSYHEATKRVSIKVFDDETGEVIREIPPEKSLDMLQKMWEMAGILVDERR